MEAGPPSPPKTLTVTVERLEEGRKGKENLLLLSRPLFNFVRIFKNLLIFNGNIINFNLNKRGKPII